MQDGIAVIVPVYNGARYIAECLQSVLAQTLAPSSVIVVDDGSEDETGEVVRRFGPAVRYERVPHGGLPYARNRGLELADREFVAFIDSDDLWLPEKLEWQMAEVRNSAAPVLVFGHIEQFASDDLTEAEAAEFRFDATPMPGRLASALLTSRRAFEIAGPFDETIRVGEFIEWSTRAQDAGIGSVVIAETICRRRIHRSNMSRGKPTDRAGYAAVLKRVLDRRRGSAAGDARPLGKT